jgi:hypothetical protein
VRGLGTEGNGSGRGGGLEPVAWPGIKLYEAGWPGKRMYAVPMYEPHATTGAGVGVRESISHQLLLSW